MEKIVEQERRKLTLQVNIELTESLLEIENGLVALRDDFKFMALAYARRNPT